VTNLMQRLINFDKKGQKQLLKGCFAHRYKYPTALRVISCQFLPPGGSTGPRNVLQLLFCEKSQNYKYKYREKITTDLKSLEFYKFLMYL
jgi:hypothetical protein